MRTPPAAPIPSHTEGIGDGSANSVLIPEQYGPIAEWINKHIRSPHWPAYGEWPLYDYYVDDDWADTGLAEGTVINTYTGTKIYSTPQGAWDDAKNATRNVSIFICPGTHAPLLIVDDNGQDAYWIRFVGTGESSIIQGTITQNEAVKITTVNSAAGDRPIHFEGIHFQNYQALPNSLCFDKNVDYGQSLTFYRCRFADCVRTRYAVTARECAFDGLSNISLSLYVLDHAESDASSWFWDCAFAGAMRPGGESYFIGCTHYNCGMDYIAFDASTGTNKSIVVEGHTFRSGAGDVWLNFFQIGSYCHVRIKNCTDFVGMRANGAAVLITSAYNYDGGKLDIVDNTWNPYNTTAVGLEIQSSSVESLLYVGNSHGSGYYVGTGAYNAVMVKCTGAGKSTRGIFGPNSPANGTYDVVGPGNIFIPGTSVTPGVEPGIIYDNGGRIIGWNAFTVRFDNSIVSVAASTATLSASNTHYVEVNSAGTVSSNTTGFTLGSIPLATVVVGASDITTLTLQSATLDETRLVKVSANDTTPNYLLAKLAAGTGITLTETNDAGDEDVTITHASIGSGDLHPEYVLESLFDAQSVLAATADNTPAALTLAEQTVVGRLTGGNVAAVSLGIADNNVVQIDAADVADNEYARFTANGLESRTAAEVLADLAVPETDILAERATQAVAANTTITVTDGSPLTPFTTTGNITNTAAPFIAAGREGQLVILRNDNGTGTLTISDTNIGAGGSLLRLSANTVTMAAGSSMALAYSTIQAAWVEEWYLALVAVTPSINSHTINIGAGASNSQNAEVANAGTDTPTFAWTFTGVPSAGTVDVSAGGDPAADYPATILTPFTSLVAPAYNKGTSVGTTRTFTPSITVNGVVKTTPTATVTYINRRYMGPSSQADSLTTAQVLGLDAAASGESGLSTIRTGSFTDIDTAAGEYIWYAYRAALGAGLYFAIESEIAGFTEKQTGLSHTNDSGFVEDFRTWRSDLANFGDNKDVDVATSAGNNRFYMGPSTDADPISNANILALDDTADGESGLYSTQARTWTAIKIEAGEYLWYCHPDRIDDLATIKDGTTGFAIAGSYRTNVSHTNQYGYVEDYRCWRSDNTGIYPSGENVVVT